MIDAFTSKCGLIESFKENGQTRAEADAGIAPARYVHQPRLLIEMRYAQYKASKDQQSNNSAQQSGTGASAAPVPVTGVSHQRLEKPSAAAPAAAKDTKEQQGASGRNPMSDATPTGAISTSASSTAKKEDVRLPSGAKVGANSAGPLIQNREAQQQEAKPCVQLLVPNSKQHNELKKTLDEALEKLRSMKYSEKLFLYVHLHEPGQYLSNCALENLPIDKVKNFFG